MAGSENTLHPEPDFAVVGIGVSTGGIEALQTLFRTLPGKTGLAFVVIPNLLSDPPGQFAEQIGKASQLPVSETKNGLLVERDHIYIAAPGEVLTLEQGRLRCRPFSGYGRSGIHLIDIFFESLAKDLGPRAVAVLLSRTGSDGASGSILIKQAGGRVFVEEPDAREYEGIPSAAIATGAFSQFLPVEAMTRALLACASSFPASIESNILGQNNSPFPLEEILGLIDQSGFDLNGYKVTPLLWQIQRRMEVRRIDQMDDYVALLHDDPSEMARLIREIPIHVTNFFRDPEAWKVLESDVIAPLVQGHSVNSPIRAWTPACSTGEEAYSLAMLLAEQIELKEKPADFQLFATDASDRIVAQASQGIYSASAVSKIPTERLARFFCASDGQYRIKKSLREKLVFAPQHLLADPPFSDLDLVTCRNLLIYLEPKALQQVLALLHASLRMGGTLFLGQGEALSPKQQGFEPISLRWHIYRKSGPLTDISLRVPKRLERLLPSKPSAAVVAAHAHRTMREKFDCPSVLIDENFNILRIYGDTTPFLRLPSGKASLNLLDLAQPELVDELQREATRALTERQAITIDGLRDSAAGDFVLNLKLTPLQSGKNERSWNLLVSFVRSEHSDGLSSSDREAAVAMENFVGWQDALRLTFEELEASREELQVLNEELRTVNDQLNLSNEEVSAVNEQLRAKIQELETQSRILSSGAVMTLFLDMDLQIRWFTPAINELFPLLPADTGREITDFMPRFKDPKFIDDILNVLRTREPNEDEIQTIADRWFLRRIRPVLTDNQTITGTAITFTDITERKRQEMHLAFLDETSDELARLTSVSEIMAALGAKIGEHFQITRYVFAEVNEAANEAVIVHQWHRKGLSDLSPAKIYRPDDFIGDEPCCAACSAEMLVVKDTATDPRLHGTSYVPLQVRSFVAVPFVRGEHLRYLLAISDQNARDWRTDEIELLRELGSRIWSRLERVFAEEALQQSERRFRGMITAMSDILYCMNADWSEVRKLSGVGFLADTGIERDWLQKYIMPEDQSEVSAAIQYAITTKSVFEMEHRVRRTDGTIGWLWTRAVPILNDDGQIGEWFGAARDVTARKQTEENEARLIALMNHNPSLVFLKDEQGRYVYINRTYQEQFAFLTHWQMKTDYDFWPKESADLFRAHDAEVLRSGRAQQFFEDSFGLDGKRYYWLCYKFPFSDAQNQRYLGGVRIDMTARVLAEEALHDNEQLLRLALESSCTGVWELDLESRNIHRSLEHERIFGYDRLLPEWTYERFLNHILPEDRTAVDAKFCEAVAKRGDWNFECRIRRADKRIRWIRAAGRHHKSDRKPPQKMIGIIQDITEHKQFEELLIKSKEQAELDHRRLAKILEAVPCAVVLIDASTSKFSYMNRRAMRLYGIDYIGFDLEAHVKKIHALKPNGILYPLEEMPVSRSLRLGEEVRNEEMIIEHADGVRLPVLVSSAPLFDASGNICMAIVVFEEIAERKQKELERERLLSELKDESEKLRAIMTGINDEIWFTDPEGIVTLLNDSARSGLGLELPHGKPIDSLVDMLEILEADGAPRPKEKTPLFRSLKGEIVQGEEIIRHAQTGVLRYRRFSSAPVRNKDGQILGAVAIANDITEHKRTEVALRDSELKYRTLLASMDEGFSIIELIFDENNQTLDYRFLEANAAFERQTGLLNVEGKTMRSLRPHHPDYWFEIYGQVALTGESVQIEEPAVEPGIRYAVHAFRIGEPWKRQVGVLFRPLPERDQSDEDSFPSTMAE